MIAYADGELDAERHAEVEAHLRHCPDCRGRMLTSDDIGRLLRTHIAPNVEDDPELRAGIMEQIRSRSATGPRAQSDRSATRERFRRLADHWRPALIVSLALVALSAIALPQESWAEFPLGRLIGFDSAEPTDSPSARIVPGPVATPAPAITLEPQPAPSELSFEPIIVQSLPGDFELSGQRWLANAHLELTYERADSFSVLLSEFSADDTQTDIDRERYERVKVAGIDVLLRRSPAFPSVDRAIWTRDNRLIVLSVPMETAKLHLDRDTALAIVEALNSAADR